MNKIHKQLVQKYGRPLKEIERICNSPFGFTMKVMLDKGDDHNVLLHHLMKFKKKSKYLNDKSQE